jgi:hypothetical protein
MANDFRRWLAIHHPDRPRIEKEAFVIYAENPENEVPEDDQAGDSHTGNDQKPARLNSNRGRKRRSGKHNQRPNRENPDACLTCGLLHEASECYYLFPEKAYPRFKPRQRITDRVNKALENDVELQALVRSAKRIRGSSRTSSTSKFTKDESAPPFSQ